MQNLTNVSKKKLILERLITVVLVASFIIINFLLWGRVSIIDSRVTNVEDQLSEDTNANKKVYDILVEIQQQQERIEERQKQQEATMKKALEEHATNISYIKNMGYSVNSDLSNADMKITAKDMDKIIDYWIFHMGVQSQFKNRGEAFIKASKASGLNPIYILAHAAIESGWGSSYMATNRHNYFGINCVDVNPNAGYTMGDDVEAGLINGAVWISNNFYKNGYTTLQEMKNGNYATDPQWAYKITSVMNNSLRAL